MNCTDCNVELTGPPSSKDRCKACYKKYHHHKDYVKHKEKRLASSKAWRDVNIAKCNARDKEYYQTNKALHNEKSKKYYEENREAIRAQRKAYRQANASKVKAQVQRYTSQPLVKLGLALRKRTSYALNSGKRFIELLGCTVSFLQLFFCFLFPKIDCNMNLSNHGSYWHIDHVQPVASFNLSNEDHIKRCFHWTNLSPLEASLNLRKNDTVDKQHIHAHSKLVEEFKSWCLTNNVDETTLDTAALQQCFAQQQA